MQSYKVDQNYSRKQSQSVKCKKKKKIDTLDTLIAVPMNWIKKKC